MLLERLAEQAQNVRYVDLPTAAVETARDAVADTLAVALAGATEPCTRIVREAGGEGTGCATLFGASRSASLLDAATVNGTAAHALDFDDCSNTMGGHPSAPIVPALWALAEREGAGGKRFLTSYAAGVEVETKLGRAVNFTHYDKGWHPTATLGTFGAAAACAHFLGLPVDRFAHALALAASMASGIKANFGTMAKPFHVGQAARNGLYAALLAEKGMTASGNALDGAQGFFDVYNGAGNFDAAKVLEGFAAPFDLVDPGIAFKRHPCCASTHPAADALLKIMSENTLQAPDILSVRSWTHPRRLRHTNRPDPRSGLDAKFSVQYVLACAALDGAVKLERFRDDAVFDPALRALMGKVEVAPHPRARMDTNEHFFAELTLVTKSGAEFHCVVDRPLGRDREHPLPLGALEAKFRDCATQSLDAGAAEALLAACRQLEAVENLRDLAPLLSGQPASRNLERLAS